VVLNELEATHHQFVSEAKYFVAFRRMSRSTDSVLRSLRSPVFSTRAGGGQPANHRTGAGRRFR
jgi:hypothetical protein